MEEPINVRPNHDCPNDFCLFVGNLAIDLKQHHLKQHFGKYVSFSVACIMHNKMDSKSRRYGFESIESKGSCEGN